MQFDSGIFLTFFAAFLLCYWLVRHHGGARNVLIVGASYLFYGWWDWHFLSLLIGSSLLDFGVGRALMGSTEPRRRKAWLALSLTGNLSLLGFFKYYGFFAESLAVALERLGCPLQLPVLNVVLPVGISFYTFQSLSYAFDVYRREIPATDNLVSFLAYVSFFPQLVAGPIERGKHLLPQMESPRLITQSMVEEGVWLIVRGMFKKVALANNLAPLADLVYQGSTFNAAAVVLGTTAFAFQIYADFSGYSDIARGTARVLGFDLMTNFNVPYAATSLREFWRRWHISLSTWLRDYLYVSLGGNRRGTGRLCLNLWLTMVLGGLWHGASWNFVLWGIWHGTGLVMGRLFGLARNPHASRDLKSQISNPGLASTGGQREMETSDSARGLDRCEREPSALGNEGGCASRPFLRLRLAAGWAATMLFVLYGWLLFRARSWEAIVAMTEALGHWETPAWAWGFVLNLGAFAGPLVLLDLWQHRAGRDQVIPAVGLWARSGVLGVMLVGILLFWKQQAAPFIYFQF